MSEKARDLAILIMLTIASLTASIVVGMFVYYGFNGSFDVPESTRTNFWAMVSFIMNSILIPVLWRHFGQSRRERRATNEQVIQTQQQVVETQQQIVETQKVVVETKEQIKQLDDTVKNGGGERIGTIAGVKASDMVIAQLQELLPQLLELTGQKAAESASQAAAATVVQQVLPVIQEQKEGNQEG